MNKNKLILTKLNNQKASYYFENGRCIEIDMETRDRNHDLNDIFIGKVKNVLPNIQAAFVEYTPGVTGYLSLSETLDHSILNRSYNGKLAIGDELIVQVKKEAHKTKNSVLTSNLTIGGTFCVVSLVNTRISYSSKLGAREKTRLKEYIKNSVSILTEHSFGCIIRTNAGELKTQEELELLGNELSALCHTLNAVLTAAKSRTVFSCLYKESDFFIKKVQNIKNSRIITDHLDIYEDLLKVINNEQLELYCDDSYPLSALHSLSKQLDEACSKKVWLKSGGYLVIERTEALTVIDVNSGKFSDKKTPEEAHLKVNLEAAMESARQIRLRNLSGIIIIDFINLSVEENNQQLLQTFRQHLKKDPVKTDLIDMTPLGLVEVTRKTTTPTLEEKLN